MTDKSTAFERAVYALSQLGIPERLPELHTADISETHSILGGSHSIVTYPPLNALRKLGPGEFMSPLYYRGNVNLYVHIAFCETACSFCHYAVETYRGRGNSSPDRVSAVDRYLSALKLEIKELKRMHVHDVSISSLYIGGGTPLVLETEQLLDLLRTLRSEFNILPDAEICIEGSPLTITAEGGLEKMQALKEAGVTRLSFGVQSFDNDVLKSAARGYKRETAIHACELAARVFDNWNVDLIQSLYKGSPDEVWANIEVLRDIRPPHATWYHGRFADHRPQGSWHRDGQRKGGFEEEGATLLGRMLIWEELARMGYGQTDGNRFVRDAQFIDPFKKSRTSVSNNLLGIGASSYSHVDMRLHEREALVPLAVFFRNKKGIGDYIAAVESGDTSVVDGAFVFGPAEHLAASYAIGLRTGRFDGDEHESEQFVREAQPEVWRHYTELVERFRNLGLIEEFQEGGRNGLRLSRRGQLFEDPVLARFYSPEVQRLLE